MVEFLSLSSGSSGNCYFIGNGQSSILIDLGVGLRSLKKNLLERDIRIEDISLVLVSHDHLDHIKSLGTFTEKYRKPVYVTDTVKKALNVHFCTRGRMSGCMRTLHCSEPNSLLEGKLTVIPFRVPHDATDTVGFYIDFYGEKFTFMTDLGEPTDDAVKYASMAEHLIVESNYDVDMLVTGPYPNELKMRIMQGHGHLSNEQTASLLRRAYHPELKEIFLCHLSENNNTPSRAFATSERALEAMGVRVGCDVTLYCLPRKEPSDVFFW